jgi:hypothetical protein
MTFLTSWLAPARRSLGGHLRRLGSSLDSVAEQVREAIARAIGRTVADAVTEAVDAALAPAEGRPDSFPPTRDAYPTSRRSPPWDDASESRWDREQQDYDPYRRPYADDYDDRDPSADDPGDEPAETLPPRRRRLGRALAAGLRRPAGGSTGTPAVCRSWPGSGWGWSPARRPCSATPRPGPPVWSGPR